MKYTIVFVFKHDMKNVLMIHKNKGPYPGCLNGIGGKIEDFDKTEELAALRELMEESNLGDGDILPLKFLVKEIFPSGTELNVFYTKIGFMAREKQMESEKLEWFKVDDLLSVKDRRLAGEGNIPYFLNYALMLEGIV